MTREELKFRVKKIVETGLSGSVLELLIIGIAEEWAMEQNLQQTDCYTTLPKSEVEQCSNCRQYTNKVIDTDRGLCYLDGISVLPHHYCPLFKGNVV